MVQLTRLNGRGVVVNAQLIATIEATPDTVVTLTTDRKIVVRETPEEVVERVQSYWRHMQDPERLSVPAGEPAGGSDSSLEGAD